MHTEAALDCHFVGGGARGAAARDALRELCAAGVVRSRDLRRRLRVDLESDLSGWQLGGGGGRRWRQRGGGGGGCAARASLEASQQLGRRALASAALGSGAGGGGGHEPGGLSWGLALERQFGSRGASGGASSSSSAGGGSSILSATTAAASAAASAAAAPAAAAPAVAKVGARLFCERSFGRQLLITAQRLLGANGGGGGGSSGGSRTATAAAARRWVEAQYCLHALPGGAGGARRATLRCSLLGSGGGAGAVPAASAVALTHQWRVGGRQPGASRVGSGWRGGVGGGGGDSGGNAKAATAPSVGSAAAAATTAATVAAAAPAAATSVAAAAAESPGIPLPGLSIMQRGADAAPPPAAAAPYAAVPTVPAPQPAWELAATCSAASGAKGALACSLQLLVHRGERPALEPPPGWGPWARGGALM